MNQPQALFQQLRTLLGNDERVHLTIEADADDGLIVLVQPVLRKRPDESEKTALAEARAALTTPLRVRASAAELDASFLDMLGRFARERTSIAADLTVLEQLSNAKSKTLKQRTKAENKADAAQAETPTETSVSGEVPPPVAPSVPAAAPASNNLFD